MDIGRPSADQLRVRIGEGLTGWVALNARTLRLGDAEADPRARQVGGLRGAESMLLVPMAWESRVVGVIVVSKAGFDQFGDDDERTLEIFAGFAAQAMVNAEAFDQVDQQRHELAHRLESQRRLLEVNERLLSTLDPSSVLEMIADSLKAVVSYDSLTIYRVDRAAWLRRPVVARDRFADLIMSHEGPLDAGVTGWAIRNGEAVLANDAHLDPRSVQIPGTPEEAESMIVCPLLVAGEVIGTLNMARMGEGESHFSRDEFELVQLFAAQASIALRNAEAHGAVVTQAAHDALTGLRNHGAFQRELGEWIGRAGQFALLMVDLDAFKDYNDTHGHPAGDALLVRIAQAMTAAVRDGDRVFRYGGDEFAILVPLVSEHGAREVADRVRTAIATLTATFGPPVTASVGVAIYPDAGITNDALVAVADRALYLAKPATRSRGSADDPTRDLYLAAVDETTIKLLERLEPRELLREIVERAAALVGVRHGFLYLLEDDGEGDVDLVARVGLGVFEAYEGYHLPKGAGIGWSVVGSGSPVVVDDYDTYVHRSYDLPQGAFGAVCGVPLTSGDETLGAHRPCLGRGRPPVLGTGGGGPDPVRPAGLRRARQRTPVRARADRGPTARPRGAPRHADRPAEPHAAAEPTGGGARGSPAGREPPPVRDADRAHPPGPGPVQGRQREPGPRGRRPAPDPGRSPARDRRPLHRHRRAPRQRRVRDPARRGAQPARGRAGCGADRGGHRGAVRPRRPGGQRRGQPGPGGGQGSRHLPGRPAQGGGDRPPSRQVGSAPDDRAVRPRDAGPDPGTRHAGARPAARDRALGAPPALPAAGGSRDRPGPGDRGPPPLAAPDPRARASALVHPAGGGDGADPPDRPVGHRDRLPPGPRVAAPGAGRGRAGGQRQPVGAPVRPGRPHRQRGAGSWTTPA